MGTIYRLLWLGVILLSYGSAAAQHRDSVVLGCAVSNLTTAQREVLERQASSALQTKQATNAAFSSVTYVPIRPHILRKSDGTGGMSLSTINQVLATTNSYYLLNGYGIQFYLAGTTPDYVDNDTYYNGYDPNDEETLAAGHDATNALNQYYVTNFSTSGLGGYAYYPEDNIGSTRSFILNEYWDLDDLGNRLIPHELGHTFNLIHTFGDNNGSGGTTELVTRGSGANCSTDGDLVCDTPADPYNKVGTKFITDGNGCVTYDPTSTARDANNALYSPSISNIMSYYFPCTHNFTPGQYDRMQAGLALRQTHKSYSLNFPPTIVAAPSNVTATLVNNMVSLSWQDNGTNEMGYFIERSLSASSGFVAIGGVGPNTTTFIDPKTTAYTTYYYRIKPSNSTTTGFSPTVSITTQTCHPTHGSSGCSFADGLNGFILNNVVLSKNSGCSVGAYSSGTAISTTVSAGQAYSFTGTLLSTNYLEGVTIWADLNHNRAFEASEILYQTPTPIAGQFSGTLSFPGSLTPGPLAVRIVVTYNAIPTDPCGTYTYGETEDYILNVVQPADLSLSLQTSSRTTVVNQTVNYALTVRNDGPYDATGIQWQNRLPAGLVFVAGDAGVVGSSTAVSGTGSLSLSAGQAATFSYLLRPTQPGQYFNAAQITASDQYDPDSQPNSGTGDGQDDEASVDIRTPESTTGLVSIYSSPNPNQTPLPAVQPNQPAPDPAKADLSLSMLTNNRVTSVGKPVTFTISVSNAGGLSASNVVIRDTLRGLTFTSSTTGMSVVASGSGYTIIEGTIASISAGESVQLSFTASPLAAGYLQNIAQVWSSGISDPDSSPGSVTPTANNLNGEDDVAWIDLRVSN